VLASCAPCSGLTDASTPGGKRKFGAENSRDAPGVR
jgi:hypothetical protein